MSKYDAWLEKKWSPATEAIVARFSRNLLVLVALVAFVAVALGGTPWSPMHG